ncbi:hypothetical protein [Nostoc sp.]|uniref:hypothetical protein n=1 Tax=Nostoc sp. TaxID=1180 RepID=UPI002FF4FA80
MSVSITQQSLDNVGFRSSTQPTPVLVFSLNPSGLIYQEQVRIKPLIPYDSLIAQREGVRVPLLKSQLRLGLVENV